MPTWDATLYLRFEKERLQPAIDLAARVALDSPQRIVDLGCGPGTSTAVLARRWPGAALTGVDTSQAMLATARNDFPQWEWIAADIGTWEAHQPFNLVFSNAALQWVPDHRRQFARLFDQVAPGGAFAAQVPDNRDAPAHALMRELASSEAWRGFFGSPPRTWHSHTSEFYYDVLSPRASDVDIWTTEYLHVLDSLDGVVEWYRGTGLRPWLDALPDEDARRRFLADYRRLLAPHFAPRADGRVLFPFPRLFIVAYR